MPWRSSLIAARLYLLCSKFALNCLAYLLCSKLGTKLAKALVKALAKALVKAATELQQSY